MHLKLDELIKALDPADNALSDVENETDERLGILEADFRKLKKTSTKFTAQHGGIARYFGV